MVDISPLLADIFVEFVPMELVLLVILALFDEIVLEFEVMLALFIEMLLTLVVMLVELALVAVST
jgi:hypothetical protein